MANPILFIHGFNGGRFEYQPLLKFLQKNGVDKFYEFTYEKKLGQASILEIAKDLDRFVSNNIQEQEIDVIGLSQGGIIFLVYLMYFGKIKIGKIFALCSPFYGSFWANFGQRVGVKDLRKNSKILVEVRDFIKNNNLQLFSVYTPFDLMVFPWQRAKPNVGKTKMVLAPLHPLALVWPSTKKFVLKNIKS